jgi:hypothetical protein
VRQGDALLHGNALARVLDELVDAVHRLCQTDAVRIGEGGLLLLFLLLLLLRFAIDDLLFGLGHGRRYRRLLLLLLFIHETEQLGVEHWGLATTHFYTQ